MAKNPSPRPSGDMQKGPMAPMGEVCDRRLGYLGGKMPDPDSLPRSGRFSRDRGTVDGGPGRSSGMGADLPRSGRFGSTEGGASDE
jgi:hypothetical protein